MKSQFCKQYRTFYMTWQSFCKFFFSWIGLKSHQPLVPCVIYYGLIPWKILEMKNPQNISHTTLLEVAHISTGEWQLNDIVNILFKD